VSKSPLVISPVTRHPSPVTRHQDRWTSIQDAQNAAAARALFDLLRDDSPGFALASEQLPDEFAALWARWAGEGGAGRGGRAAEEDAKARDEFLR